MILELVGRMGISDVQDQLDFFFRVSVQNAGNAAHTWLRHARKGAHAYVLHEWIGFEGKKIDGLARSTK